MKKKTVDREAIVRKSNELIQKTRFDLSLQQQKIILYLISKITPFDDDFETYTFSTEEFCKVCGIDDTSGKNRNDVKKAIKNIADKSIWVRTDEHTESLLRWIEKAKLNDHSGTIEIRLDADMKPYLLQLKKNYTQYDIIYTLGFKSKYSIRLYELLASVHFHDLQEYRQTYTVDELKERMGANLYTEYRDFKQKALMRALAEINELSDKNITFTETKVKKKVQSVEFTITSKDSVQALEVRNRINAALDKYDNVIEGQESLFYTQP